MKFTGFLSHFDGSGETVFNLYKYQVTCPNLLDSVKRDWHIGSDTHAPFFTPALGFCNMDYPVFIIIN